MVCGFNSLQEEDIYKIIRLRAQGTGHRAQGTGHRAQGTGRRAQGTGYRAQGFSSPPPEGLGVGSRRRQKTKDKRQK